MRYQCTAIAIAMMACGTSTNDGLRASNAQTNKELDAITAQVTDSANQNLIDDAPPTDGTPTDATSTLDANTQAADVNDTDGKVTRDNDTNTKPKPSLIEESCAKDLACGFADTLNQCVTAMEQLQNSGPPACKSALQTLLQCKVKTLDPCASPELSECAPMYQTFQEACMGGGTSTPIATQWKKICGIFATSTPENCPAEFDMESVVDLCNFIAEVLSNTPECLEKVNLYLACAPDMTFYCQEGQLVPVPKEPNPCEERAMPFAFPDGECVGG